MAEDGDAGEPAGAAPSGDSRDVDRAGERDEDRPADAPPEAVVDGAERLTRLARDAVDDAEAAAYLEDRDASLAEYDYVARVREEDSGAVLVCHPAEWVEDGVVRTERVDDLGRGIERRVAGAGEADGWEEVEAHNRDLARAVAAEHGDVHGANAHAFADFMGNHYAKAIEDATRAEVEEFLAEYFPRNAFPSDAQRECVAESVRLVYDVGDEDPPLGT